MQEKLDDMCYNNGPRKRTCCARCGLRCFPDAASAAGGAAMQATAATPAAADALSDDRRAQRQASSSELPLVCGCKQRAVRAGAPDEVCQEEGFM